MIHNIIRVDHRQGIQKRMLCAEYSRWQQGRRTMEENEEESDSNEVNTFSEVSNEDSA